MTPKSGGGCPHWVPLATGRGGRQGTSSNMTVVVLHCDTEEEEALRRRVNLNPVCLAPKPKSWLSKGRAGTEGLCSPRPWDMGTWTKQSSI